MSKKIKAFLTHPHLPWIVTGIGVVFGIPAILPGWGGTDDLLQRGFLLSSTLPEALTKLYTLLDPSTNATLMDSGVLPWWTLRNAQVIFFRPVAAFSLWLDYQIWPDCKLLMHLHSLILYAALCLIAAGLYRRLLGKSIVAGLASLLFVLSPAHTASVISLAARNLLLTACFGLLCLWLHDRWRKDGWRAGLFLASLCLVLSLLSSETGVATFAYLLAYALFLDVGNWQKRVTSLLPYLLLILGWWFTYNWLGYGAFGSGFYINPSREPFEFLKAIIERTPMLLMGQWVVPDPVIYGAMSIGVKFLYWLISVCILGALTVLLEPLVQSNRLARVFVFGMLIAVIPLCTVDPASGRHMVLVSFGAFGLMAQFISGRLDLHAWLPARKSWRIRALVTSLVLLGLHALVYPVVVPIVRLDLNSYAVATTDLGSHPEETSRDIFLTNAPSPGQFIYIPALRDLYNQPMPAHLRALAPGFSPVHLTRIDEYTLLVQPESGYLAPPGTPVGSNHYFLPPLHTVYAAQYGDGFFRNLAYPLELNERVMLSGFEVEVVSLTVNGRPLQARARFSLPLEDPSFIWLMWDWADYRFKTFTPPEIGETVTLPGPY